VTLSPIWVSTSYTVTDQAGQSSSSFTFTAFQWGGSKIQQQANFAGLHFQTSFTPGTFSIDDGGNIDVPLATLVAEPQDALLIDEPLTLAYLSLKTQVEGELSAQFKVRDFLSALSYFAQMVAYPVALVQVSAILAGEITSGLGGLAGLGARFPGLLIDTRLPGFEQTLIDELGGWVGDLTGITGLSLKDFNNGVPCPSSSQEES